MTTPSSILAWKMPRTEEPGRLQSMGFSSQEYWSGLPFPSPGDLSDPEIEPGFPALQADSLPTEPPGTPQADSINICYSAVIIKRASSHS